MNGFFTGFLISRFLNKCYEAGLRGEKIPESMQFLLRKQTPSKLTDKLELKHLITAYEHRAALYVSFPIIFRLSFLILYIIFMKLLLLMYNMEKKDSKPNWIYEADRALFIEEKRNMS